MTSMGRLHQHQLPLAMVQDKLDHQIPLTLVQDKHKHQVPLTMVQDKHQHQISLAMVHDKQQHQMPMTLGHEKNQSQLPMTMVVVQEEQEFSLSSLAVQQAGSLAMPVFGVVGQQNEGNMDINLNTPAPLNNGEDEVKGEEKEERQDTGSQDIDRQDIVRQDIDRQVVYRQDIDRQDINRQDEDRQDADRQDEDRQDTDSQDADRNDTNRQDTEYLPEVETRRGAKAKPRRRASRRSARRKRLNEYIDVNLSGRPYDFASLDLAAFVAGFLQEIVSTKQFKTAGRGLQERIKHLSFLVHLACRFDTFEPVMSHYQTVEGDLECGTASWGDEQYFRAWEQRILTQIYFSDHLNDDGEFEMILGREGGAAKLEPKLELAETNGNVSEDSLRDFIDDGGSDYEDEDVFVNANKPPRKKAKTEKEAVSGPVKEKQVRKRRQPQETSFYCTHCGETVTVTDGQSKKQHMRVCKPHKPLPCDSEGCDFSTIHAKRLEKHKFEVHERTMCNICGMNLDTFSSYTAHMEAHKPEKCQTCGKCFKNTHMLKNHINSTHNKEADEPCHICGKVYKNVANHVRLVHEYAIQNCPHCPYTTRITTDLARHVRRTHTEETVTTCPYCAKTTKNIKRHLQQNRCDKPEERVVISVKCDRCDKTFSSKEHMKRHVKRVHDKILDVPCPHCDYKTYCNFNLRIHVTRVHEGKALKQACPYCLQNVISLDWHLKMYHAEKVPGWTGAKTKEETVDSLVEYTLQ